MANPYEQFDKKEKSNPYAQFDKKKENVYSKFDAGTTSVGEDIAIGWGDVGKVFQDAAEVGVSGLMGVMEKLPGAPSDIEEQNLERFKNIKAAGEKTRSDIDVWANPEGKEQTFGGKVIGTLGSLPAQVAAIPFSPAQTGKEFIDVGETAERAQEAALIDTGGNVIGFALPGALGGKLATKVATGAGIGASQDYAVRTALSDIAQTEEGKRKFAPTLESTALAGIVGGAVGGISPSTKTKATSKVEAPADVEVPALGEVSRDSSRILEDASVQIGKDIDRAEYKLKKIEQEIGERQFESPEQASQFKQAKLEEASQLVREIQELKQSLDTANKYMGKEAPAPTRAEIPSGPPPRPEGVFQDVEATQREPITAEEAPNKDMFDQVPEETIEMAPLESMGEAEFEGLSGRSTKELEDEISTLDVTSSEGQYRFEQLAQELASRVAPKERRAVIEGGSESIRSIVKDWLVKTGLDREDISINLDAQALDRPSFMGDATVLEGDMASVRVRGAADIAANPRLRQWLTSLSREEDARFKEAWTAAHELGHILLVKVIQNKLYSDSLGFNKVLKEFHAWKEKDAEQVRKSGELFAKSKDEDYYTSFGEFFAQRVAKELTMGSTGRGVISKFVADLKQMVREILKAAKLPAFANNFVDDFIKDLLAKNKQTLAETGKTLWEIDSTTVSMKEAWDWQWDAQIIPSKKQKYTASGMADNANIKNAVRHIQNADSVIAAQQAAPDINPVGAKSASKYVSTLLNRAGSNLFGILNKAQFYKNSPMVSYAADVILNGLHQQTRRSMELLTGVTDRVVWDKQNKLGISLKKIKDEDSFSVIAEKSSNEDFFAIHQILEKGIGKYSYEESLAMFGQGLSEQQKSLYRATTKMYANMYKMAAQTEQALGKKGIIPNMKGWYPAMRKGEFTVNFRIEGVKRVAGRDPTGKALMTDLVHSQSFRTEGEARAFIEHFEKQSPEFRGMLRHNGVEKAADPEMINSLADFHRAYQEQRTKLDAEIDSLLAGTAPKWLQQESKSFEHINDVGYDKARWVDARIQKMVDMYIARGGTLGGHHRLRTNVSGAMGSEMFTTTHNAGKAFRDANFKAVDEYTNMMMKMDIQEKLDLMLSKEELKQSHPNTLEVVQLMRDYALNEVKSPMEMKGFKAAVDAVWEQMWDKTPMKKMKVFGAEKYMEAPVTDLALGKLGHMFYIHALMSRPSFWAAQGVQFLWAGRTMVKDGVGPVGAMTHAGKGLWQVLHPDREFMDAIFHVSQTSHTFAPQFINELNKHGLGEFLQEGSKGKFLLDIATGEKQSTMADTFSRLMTFGMVYEHYKSKGLTGNELAEAAAKATDENMVQYSRQYKAPVFQKMGVVGDLVAPLQTFSQAALGNLVADVGSMLQAPGGKAKVKAALPFMATVAITGLMAGAIGVPLVAEYEALRLFINYLSEKLGGEPFMPSVVDAVLQGDNTFSNRLLSHGLLSATTMPMTGDEGLDIAASNRWQPLWGGIVLGEKTFMESIPVLNFWLDRAGDVTDIVKHRVGISELTDAERRNAALGIVPGMYKGAIDDLLFDAQTRDFVPTMKGDAFTEQTDVERAAKYLGTSTVKSSTERLRERRLKEEEMRTQQKVDKTFELLADAVQKGNKMRVNQLSRKLADDFQIDVDQQESRLRRELMNRSVPSRTRQFVGSGGTSSTQQQKRARQWEETYETSPLENE